ncbi:hypothetical protein [Luteimonas salinisoli]|uniref:hypothetical protein n=1 Tax=Luteimonas salinisoli TaxID=2752307 RepID=UPI001C5CB853|nr:hypothetical protein [Luteimonas salinisoli]
MTLEQWPSKSGEMHMGGGASLRTAGGTLPADDQNFGYCPGGCGYHRIEPGGELDGFIAYAAFDDPEQIAAEAVRELKFSVTPFYCPKSQ